MSVSDADIAFATDLLSPLGGLSTRKMFGGLGIYHDGAIFALLSSAGQLFIKTDTALAAELAAEGSTQFHNMPYWSMPEAALDDPEVALNWAQRSLTAVS